MIRNWKKLHKSFNILISKLCVQNSWQKGDGSVLDAILRLKMKILQTCTRKFQNIPLPK